MQNSTQAPFSLGGERNFPILFPVGMGLPAQKPPPSCFCSPIARGICVAQDTEKYFHLLFPWGQISQSNSGFKLSFARTLPWKTKPSLSKQSQNPTVYFPTICRTYPEKKKFSSRRKRNRKKKKRAETSY